MPTYEISPATKAKVEALQMQILNLPNSQPGQPQDQVFQRQILELQIRVELQGDAIAFLGNWPR